MTAGGGDWRLGSFVNRDGLSLCWRDYGAADGAPILCAPGLTRNARDFEDLAPFLADRGYRVLALDLRGRGASDPDPDPARYAPATYAADVLELVDHWAFPRPPVIIGVSLGGLIAMLTAAERPGLWAGAVLDDIGPEIAPDGVRRLKSYVGIEPLRFPNWDEAIVACRRINEDALLGLCYEEWATIARRQCVEAADGTVAFDYDPAIGANIQAADPDAAVDLWPVFDALAARPIHILRGAHSDILSAEVYAEMLAHERVEGAVIANRGHAPTLDEPEARDAILSLIARTRAA